VAIVYTPYQKIDKIKWDACIHTAPNGLVYAYSFYLDAMANYWDALVLNDYEAVMPLTWNKKYGIAYLYQPFFTASLGVFGPGLNITLVNDFLNAIPSQFKYWDIYLNRANHFHPITIGTNNFSLYQRVNYVLPLNDSYENLFTNFRDNTKRNIKKSVQLNCVVKKGIDIADVIALAKDQSKNFSPVTEKDFNNFKALYLQLQQQQKAITYGICSPNGELVSSAAFFFSHERAYYILAGNHPNGKTIGASHALINAFIKDYAGQNLLLDFEGSDMSKLAFFYSSFGAREEKYAGLKLNKLPFWMQWFKR
jgi:hypothetical protein